MQFFAKTPKNKTQIEYLVKTYPNFELKEQNSPHVDYDSSLVTFFKQAFLLSIYVLKMCCDSM